MSGLLPRVLLSPKEDIFVFIFGFRRGARWRCALFFVSSPLDLRPVSRVSYPACSRVFRVPPCPGGWFVFFVGGTLVVPCLFLYPRRAAPRRAQFVCFSLLSFLLVLFLRLRLESQFQEKFSSFFFLFSRCFDSQPQTQGVISPGLQVSHHFF